MYQSIMPVFIVINIFLKTYYLHKGYYVEMKTVVIVFHILLKYHLII